MKDVNLEINQGATLQRILTFTDENGMLIDLSGRSFAGQIRKSFKDPVLVASFVFEILDQILDKGKVRMTLPASALTSLTLTETVCYRYDVEMTDLAIVTRVLQGEAKIYPEITK